jgi:hypothetical protein
MTTFCFTDEHAGSSPRRRTHRVELEEPTHVSFSPKKRGSRRREAAVTGGVGHGARRAVGESRPSSERALFVDAAHVLRESCAAPRRATSR